MQAISKIMDLNTLRIYLVNGGTYLATSINGISENMKLILIVASIIYTIIKSIDIVKGWSKKNKKNR